MEPPLALDDATDRLVRTVMLVGVAPALLLGIITLVLVHPLVGILIAVLVAVGWAAFVWTRVSGATARVLDPLAASGLAAGSEPRFENLLEGVCMVGGIEEPAVRLLPDTSLNALAVADASGATFVVTRGLLDGLGRVELEGVLANLAARVKNGSARYAAVVLALPLPASAVEKLLKQGLGTQSSVRSDIAAVGLTKYPPGLISALGVLDERGTRVASASPESAPLWLAAPGAANDTSAPADSAGAADDDVAPQPLSLRIAVLQEL